MSSAWLKWVFFCVVICACTPVGQEQVLPTQMLVEPQLTETPVPATSTTTSTPLPLLGDLLTTTPDVILSPPSLSSSDVPSIDPVASELVALAQHRLSQDLNLLTRRIRLISVTPYTWSDTSLGCPLPGETYPAVSIDGYRILLSVDEQEYIFHTDFDRVTACEAANEKLPSSDSG